MKHRHFVFKRQAALINPLESLIALDHHNFDQPTTSKTPSEDVNSEPDDQPFCDVTNGKNIISDAANASPFVSLSKKVSSASVRLSQLASPISFDLNVIDPASAFSSASVKLEPQIDGPFRVLSKTGFMMLNKNGTFSPLFFAKIYLLFKIFHNELLCRG